MADRLPAPGPSHIPEIQLEIAGTHVRAGIAEPTILTDDWWLALLWVSHGDGLLTFREAASAAGPPADPPLFRLGPALAGALSGMILEDGGRQMMRLRHGSPPRDPMRPWDAPLVVLAGFRWEPARAATMGATAIEEMVLDAFARSVAGLHRP